MEITRMGEGEGLGRVEGGWLRKERRLAGGWRRGEGKVRVGKEVRGAACVEGWVVLRNQEQIVLRVATRVAASWETGGRGGSGMGRDG